MINQIIPASYMETIKSRIKDIITNEITNQKTLSTGSTVPAIVKYNQQLLTFFKGSTLNIYCDRFNQLNEDELNGIIVNIAKETDSKGSTAKTQATATFTIDVVVDGKTDIEANETAQRVSSSIRHIFLTPLYVRLGFDTGTLFIRSVRLSGRTFYVPESNDANNLTGISIELVVEYDEKIIQGTAVILEGNDTVLAQKFTITTETEVD